MNAFLQEMVAAEKITEEYRGAVRTDKICKFLKAEIGYRAWKAQRAGKLYREKPFFLTIPAKRLDETLPADENVLIQGIIDMYFVEGDGIVLLDYKTDRIDSMEALRQRYEMQIDYYQEALERLTHLPVKERILYSFSLDRY